MGEMHHLDVGCADASFIITGTATFLVDCDSIDRYQNLLPANKRLRGVFMTHQHRDHYSGLQYLRSNGYSIDCLIYSPYERRYNDSSVTAEEWREFNSHRDYFAGRGTSLHAPYRQDSFNKPFWDTNGAQFWVLGPSRDIATSDTRELHDACLVVKADLNQRHCLFTGDASDTNLERVATMSHICDDILHASHHGSLNGAHLGFIRACNAGYTVISTRAGVHQNVPHPTALQRYRDNTKHRVYRTDQSGTVSWTF